MSKTGDVVWANEATWQRDESTANPGTKNWWYSVTQSDGIGSLLADLKRHADFRWLVRDAQPVDGYDEGEAATWEATRRLLKFGDGHSSFADALNDLLDQAALFERRRIVDYLESRCEGVTIEDLGAHRNITTWRPKDYAAAIERGAHLRGDDE